MIVKELDWGEKKMVVRKIRGFPSGFMECDGFKANPRQLEILRLRAMGKEYREIAEELTIAWGTVKSHLYQLKKRNAGGMEGEDWPSTMELIWKAEELELLSPYAIEGLKSILEKI